MFNDNVLTVANIITDKLIAKEVKTDKLCVGETCINENDLKDFLKYKSQTQNFVDQNNSDTNSSPDTEIIPNQILPTSTSATTSAVENLQEIISTTTTETVEVVKEIIQAKNVDISATTSETIVN